MNSQISESVIEVCQDHGMVFKKQGNELYSTCPFHLDGKRPNFRVNIDKNSWFCDVCGEGGGVVEFIAKKQNRDKKDVFKELINKDQPTSAPTGSTLVATYDYTDGMGDLLYQVCRFTPKTFRQRQPDDKGGWIWNMDGIERVLYRLPEILNPKNKFIWIVEGEKDVETLRTISMAATCNVGGAGKWIEAYNQTLKDKEIVICGDNDDPGRRHMRTVMDSIETHVASIRVITLPSQFKDISDFAASFPDKDKFAEALMPLIAAAPVMLRGASLPVKSMAELEAEYREHIKTCNERTVNLAKWIPSLSCVRPLVPGELVSVIGDTGTSKTYVLQHLAYCCGVYALLFELELPNSLTFERFVSMARRTPGSDVFNEYRNGGRCDHSDLSHIYVCGRSKLTPDEIESIILKSELKMGVRPSLVLVDYIQLVHGFGKSRYEKVSGVAEQLKIIAKNTGTVIVMASQVGRDKESPEIRLHDAKDSGSIENSSGVVIGIWRDQEKADILNLRVIKNTKGRRSEIIPCKIDQSCMWIVEASGIDDADIPKQRTNNVPQQRELQPTTNDP